MIWSSKGLEQLAQEVYGEWAEGRGITLDWACFHEGVVSGLRTHLNGAPFNRTVDRDIEMLRLRFDERQTRAAIGRTVGLSGERVRQIEMRTLRRLRHPDRRRTWEYRP